MIVPWPPMWRCLARVSRRAWSLRGSCPALIGEGGDGASPSTGTLCLLSAYVSMGVYPCCDPAS